MTSLLGRIALGSYLCAALGCFGDAPSIGAEESSGGTSGGNDTTMSASATTASTASPTSAPDDSGSGSEDPTAGICGDGTREGDEICDDGNQQDGDGCEADCQPSSGHPFWTVVQDEEGILALYTVVVTPEGDIVAGGAIVDADDNTHPWLGRYAPDGTLLWSEATPADGGSAHYRGLITLADGRVLGVGGVDGPDAYDNAWLRVVDADGAVAWQHEVQTNTANTYFLGVVPRADGGLVAVGSATDNEGTRPFVAGFDPSGGDWIAGLNSEDLGSYLGTYGRMFAVVPQDNRLLVVGSLQPDPMQPSDAAAWLLDADGYPLDQPDVFGGEGDQDLIDLAVDGAVVHAIGRTGAGDVSAVRIARLGVGDTVAIEWEETWADLPFNVANALAVSAGVRYVAASTNDDGMGDDFDSRVLRWDGEEDGPRWVMPFADPSPGVDYAGDVAVAPDGTIVVVGPMTPDDGTSMNGWIRKLAP